MDPVVQNTAYTGRFAPSPTGELHFGSLVAAVESFLQARQSKGKWLVRMEDIDPPREVPGSAASIIRDLERLGLRSDRPVLYQSSRTEAYQAAAEILLREGKAFHCGCSRKDLPSSGRYPGTCRSGLGRGKASRTVRLRVDSSPIEFSDLVQGDVRENLENSVGDFVIWRADGLPAYQLAVVVDDAYQDITEVVRGADLLDSTARQIYLQRCLGLATPSYAHLPVAMHSDGKKLGKRYRSDPVASVPAQEAIFLALQFLGQSPPEGLALDELWRWACTHWQLASVPPCVDNPIAP
jgi:glutamyl-Q tRNA(Asp) synthetase